MLDRKSHGNFARDNLVRKLRTTLRNELTILSILPLVILLQVSSYENQSTVWEVSLWPYVICMPVKCYLALYNNRREPQINVLEE